MNGKNNCLSSNCCSSLYTRKFIITVLASGAGPLISIFLFLYFGNTWLVSTCRAVVLVGLVPMIIPLVLMMFFDDDKALDHASEAIV